ncbi:MAG: hypothetical protein JSS96_01190, partial [Bacteroidetes bacterium]|nr:hypothetical protein [Bacteroidota bacterium]
MITQSSIPYITQMLDEPHLLSETDQETVTALIEAFPYFVPARYMEAAEQHRLEPFAASTMSMMQLYRGNWLLYWQFMQDALGEQALDATTLAEKMKEEAEEPHLTPQEEEILSAEEAYITPEVEEIVMAEETNYFFEETKNEPVVAENDETLI